MYGQVFGRAVLSNVCDAVIVVGSVLVIQVERIVVANHTTARVIMKEPVDLRSMADGGGDTMASRSEVRRKQEETPVLCRYRLL